MVVVALPKWIFLACFMITCSYFVLGTSSEACDHNDLQALREFKGNLTNGSIVSTWTNESICCQWEGVECEHLGSSNRVSILNLSGKGLIGRISPSLGRLDRLELLDLSLNGLKGELPLEISNLTHLGILDFSHNKLKGPIWKSLAGLNSIRSLNVSSNSIRDVMSGFRGYPNLVSFNMSNNLITGRFNPLLCGKTIRVLDLSMNHLIGEVDGLENCSSTLELLHMDSNDLSGRIPDSLYSVSRLQQFSISCNNFSGGISQRLSKLSSLQSFVIHGNRFSGLLPDVFGNLTSLEHLTAHSNMFSGFLPSSLSLCSKLKILDLRNNSLLGGIHIDFSNLTRLCTMDIASNRLSGPLPDSLSNCRELRVLSLAKNELTGPIPESYANLSSLFFLSLSNNSFVNLTGALSVLRHCKNLTTLILTRNFHGEEVPSNMDGFQSLTVFAIGNCGLFGHIPVWLSSCHKLQVLDLSWNRLNGSIPSWIGNMDSLFYLDFSNNSLTGEIPIRLTELKSLVSSNSSSSTLSGSTGVPLFVKRNQSGSALQYNQASSFPPAIYLNNNRINGTIPEVIGRLKQLHILDLSWNHVEGTIPNSISDMENLEVLDLSNNGLHGSIPASLSKLTFLSMFDVANNNLSGEIPKGNQFSSFPPSSFEGNHGLCGMMDSPCLKGVKPSKAKPKPDNFSRLGSIFGISIGLGVGVALLLSALMFSIRRKNNVAGDPTATEDFDFDEETRQSTPNMKLVLFENLVCGDLTIPDLLKSTNNFSQSNIIGCGGFGLVYKANLPNGLSAAVKRLTGDCGQMEREFQAEVEALSLAQHRNLVSLQGYCQYGDDRLLIYSYMENGSLDYWLHEAGDGHSCLNWETRLRIAQGAARGLAYLHKEHNIIHRDVKTSNILLDDKFEAHLADFGLSRLVCPYATHVTTDLVGTLGYIPPEYAQAPTATFRGDVYSFGVVVLELVSGRRPVEVGKGKNCRDLVSWAFQMKLDNREEEVFDSSMSNQNHEKKQILEAFGIACKCLDQDPKRRPSIDQVVSWLDEVSRLQTDF